MKRVQLYTACTDVRRGTSGTSRDVPIFVQFHTKIRTVDDTQREKKVAKKIADLEKNIKRGRQKEKEGEREREREKKRDPPMIHK